MRERAKKAGGNPCRRLGIKCRVGGPSIPASSVVVSHEAFKREAVIQRIVGRLRTFDLDTLEDLACMFEPDGPYTGC